MSGDARSLRAFIAVSFSATPELRTLLTALHDMGSEIRPVSATQLHITLKFLGDMRPSLVPEVIEVLQRSARGVSELSLNLRGLGAFPNDKRPEVVWVGLAECPPLAGIAASLERDLAPLGFTPERRPFHPHLTITRLKRRPPDALFELLTGLRETDFGSVAISSVELFQSELLRDGARHSLLAAAPLPPLTQE